MTLKIRISTLLPTKNLILTFTRYFIRYCLIAYLVLVQVLATLHNEEITNKVLFIMIVSSLCWEKGVSGQLDYSSSQLYQWAMSLTKVTTHDANFATLLLPADLKFYKCFTE